LLLVALASLVLGMGVPVTAAYLITAVLAVPPLGDLGVPILCAHMIVYWLSQDSNITPPVCVAAYAGAAIAGSDPWKTGWTSFKYAKLLYVVPILMAFTPEILFQSKAVKMTLPELENDIPFANVMTMHVKSGDSVSEGDLLATVLVGDQPLQIFAESDGEVTRVRSNPGSLISPGDVLVEGEIKASRTRVISSFVSAFLGTIAFSALTMFFWVRKTTVPEWLVLAVATVLLYTPGVVTDLTGIVLVTAIGYIQHRKNKRDQALAAA
jgi:TRAP-type uncharacterized transport system fused permease subunit